MGDERTIRCFARVRNGARCTRAATANVERLGIMVHLCTQHQGMDIAASDIADVMMDGPAIGEDVTPARTATIIEPMTSARLDLATASVARDEHGNRLAWFTVNPALRLRRTGRDRIVVVRAIARLRAWRRTGITRNAPTLRAVLDTIEAEASRAASDEGR